MVSVCDGQKGIVETTHRGGEAGISTSLRVCPCLQWTKLTDVPDLDEQLIDRIVEQSDGSCRAPVSELEDERDANLVAMLKALRKRPRPARFSIAWTSNADLMPSTPAMSIELATPTFPTSRFVPTGARGSYPENTRAAFDAAASVGAGWIETDIQCQPMASW